jgi:hypothetical protein
MLISNHFKTGQNRSKTLCISDVPQTVGDVQYNIDVLQTPLKNLLKIDHDSLLLHPFRFTIHDHLLSFYNLKLI